MTFVGAGGPCDRLTSQQQQLIVVTPPTLTDFTVFSTQGDAQHPFKSGNKTKAIERTLLPMVIILLFPCLYTVVF